MPSAVDDTKLAENDTRNIRVKHVEDAKLTKCTQD